ELGQRIAELLINPTATRERLADGIYKAPDPGNPLGLLQQALELAEQVKPAERKVFEARRAGAITSEDVPGQIAEAEAKGIVTEAEAAAIRHFDATVMALTAVDDFDPLELPRVVANPPAAAERTA